MQAYLAKLTSSVKKENEESVSTYRNKTNNTYIAGSAAVSKFIKDINTFILKCNIPILPIKSFKNKDTDIFHLKSTENYHHVMGDIDMIYTTAQSIEDLLLREFDLPCVRVAIDYINSEEGTYIVSAQFLYAIFTGKYYLPEGVESSDKLVGVVKSKCIPVVEKIILKNYFFIKGGIDDVIISKHNKLNHRNFALQNHDFEVLAPQNY
jgi:hypothetical protein